VRRMRHVNERNFAGKVVFITGGSRGLGLAVADQFLRAGANVAIAARDPGENGVGKKQQNLHEKKAKEAEKTAQVEV
jgi:NAD(P)-dependent dehydrogenase (short-subunit alcohol dehydrogenase family)